MQCPHCGLTTTFARKTRMHFFTIFFVPLFPVSGARTVLECQNCHAKYDLGAIDLVASQASGRLASQTT